MTDHELLEMAARAAGIDLDWSVIEGVSPQNTANWNSWNPLADDGDCARLEVALHIETSWAEDYGVAARQQRPAHRPVDWRGEPYHDHNGDRNAARRRASVRAAAEVGTRLGEGEKG